MPAVDSWAGAAHWVDLSTSWAGVDLYVPGAASALTVSAATATPLTIAVPTMTGA